MRSLTAYVRHGPSSKDGTPGWFVGNLLWWRLWASIVVMLLPLGAGLQAALMSNLGIGLLVTWIVGVLAAPWMMRASPLYELTEADDD